PGPDGAPVVLSWSPNTANGEHGYAHPPIPGTPHHVARARTQGSRSPPTPRRRGGFLLELRPEIKGASRATDRSPGAGAKSGATRRRRGLRTPRRRDPSGLRPHPVVVAAACAGPARAGRGPRRRGLRLGDGP